MMKVIYLKDHVEEFREHLSIRHSVPKICQTLLELLNLEPLTNETRSLLARNLKGFIDGCFK